MRSEFAVPADLDPVTRHPKAAKPMELAGIPIRLKNTFEPDHPGTLIKEVNHMELRDKVRGVALDRAQSATVVLSLIQDIEEDAIAAGRADLCALARPHLADPAWTLHAAAEQGVKDIVWPKQYVGGKVQLERNLVRVAQLALDA